MYPTQYPPQQPQIRQRPTLHELLAQRKPVYVKNVQVPASVILLNYKLPGDKTSRQIKLPVTDAPIPLHEKAPYDCLQNCFELTRLIDAGLVYLFWPDEVGQLNEQQRAEIAEAYSYAIDPNQGSYDTSRMSTDVQIVVDEDEEALARGNQVRNARMVVLIEGMKRGTYGAAFVLRQLQANSRDYRENDYKFILSQVVGASPSDAQIREWAFGRLQALQLGQGVHHRMPPGTEVAMNNMRRFERSQYPRPPVHVPVPGQAATSHPVHYPAAAPAPVPPGFTVDAHGQLVPIPQAPHPLVPPPTQTEMELRQRIADLEAMLAETGHLAQRNLEEIAAHTGGVAPHQAPAAPDPQAAPQPAVEAPPTAYGAPPGYVPPPAQPGLPFPQHQLTPAHPPTPPALPRAGLRPARVVQVTGTPTLPGHRVEMVDPEEGMVQVKRGE